MIFIFSFISLTARSEYRVYKYLVSAAEKKYQDNQTYTVTSTLNPQAYIAYHGGKNSINVDLIMTWKCFGYTGNKLPLCESPYKLFFDNQPKKE